jgi:hypothetical protein
MRRLRPGTVARIHARIEAKVLGIYEPLTVHNSPFLE